MAGGFQRKIAQGRWRVSFPGGLFALIIALLGLAPHIGFSLSHGQFLYYFSAWDEETYGMAAATEPLWHSLNLSRLLGAALFRFFHSVSGSLSAAYVASDVVFPMLAAIAAYLLAGMFVDKLAGWTARFCQVAIAVLTLCAFEVFSLSALVLWPPYLNLPYIQSHLPAWTRPFLVGNYATFVSLYRTPEPQVSVTVFLFFLLGLLKLLRGWGEDQRISWALIVIGFGLLSAGYFTFFLSAAALLVCAAIWLYFVAGRKAPAAILAGISTVTFIAMGLFAVRWTEHVTAQDILVFSRLPLISMSVVLGLVGLALTIFWRHSISLRQWEIFIAVIGFIYPVAALNQQLFTGVLVMPSVIERTTSYLFLVVGFSALWCAKGAPLPLKLQKWCETRRLSPLIPILLVAFMHFTGTAMRFPANETSMIQAALYEKAIGHLRQQGGGIGTSVKVILPDLQAALFQSRVQPFPQVMASYERIVIEGAPREEVFERLWRLGVDPGTLRQRLVDAFNDPSLLYWQQMFLPSKAVWPAYSNYRDYDPSTLKKEIDWIVKAYELWRKDWCPASDPVVLIVNERLPQRVGMGVATIDLGSYVSPWPYVPPQHVYVQLGGNCTAK